MRNRVYINDSEDELTFFAYIKFRFVADYQIFSRGMKIAFDLRELYLLISLKKSEIPSSLSIPIRWNLKPSHIWGWLKRKIKQSFIDPHIYTTFFILTNFHKRKCNKTSRLFIYANLTRNYSYENNNKGLSSD